MSRFKDQEGKDDENCTCEERGRQGLCDEEWEWGKRENIQDKEEWESGVGGLGNCQEQGLGKLAFVRPTLR